ncbi:MAG: hypothetical protein R3E01_17725 [Pirellulaceae bacterium]|nr:hypothetical protein [Planctomycetales bacterium]
MSTSVAHVYLNDGSANFVDGGQVSVPIDGDHAIPSCDRYVVGYQP